MLIDRASRDALCSQLQQLRAAAIETEHAVLTDRITPVQLAADVLTLREHIETISHAASELLPTR
jgi:hypothetical protein